MTGYTQRPSPANDQDIDRALETKASPEIEPESPYFFEICQMCPTHAPLTAVVAENWLLRLISPAGAALVECAGYPDEATCRAAVLTLKAKAGAAEISVTI